MIRLQAPQGLGDAIYLRAIALHLSKRGEEVSVYTAWPDLFADLRVEVHRRHELAHADGVRHAAYCLGCLNPAVLPVDLFRRACLRAGVYEDVPLKLEWRVRNRPLVESVRASARGRRVLLFQPLKIASNPEEVAQRPDARAFARELAARSDRFTVRVGHPNYVDAAVGPAGDMDLLGRTSVTDVVDVAADAADEFFSEPCYLPIVAQALERPFTCLFSRRATASNIDRVRNLTPERLMPRSGLAIYDEAA